MVPLFGSGLFSVPKDLEKDRLILDSRGPNLLESPPQRRIRSLGSAEVLCHISLEPEETLVASGIDHPAGLSHLELWVALGDWQAVELAQGCHLGLGLQSDVVTAGNLLTMYKLVPRTSTMVGLAIYDFIAFSKVARADVGRQAK